MLWRSRMCEWMLQKVVMRAMSRLSLLRSSGWRGRDRRIGLRQGARMEKCRCGIFIEPPRDLLRHPCWLTLIQLRAYGKGDGGSALPDNYNPACARELLRPIHELR